MERTGLRPRTVSEGQGDPKTPETSGRRNGPMTIWFWSAEPEAKSCAGGVAIESELAATLEAAAKILKTSNATGGDQPHYG